jgi:hypothetical protein
MANTANFGWETPDDTDLVKDGAASIRTLGSAIDTSFVDLKGGTTGQNLRKATNTDLDFTWAGDATNTVIDAEGDLLVGDSADTLQRLAIGTTGQVLTVDTAVDGKVKWAAAASSSYIGAAAYRQGTNINYTQNVETLITYSDEEFDSSGFWEGVTNPGRMTIPAGLGGKYLINFQWRTATGLNNCGVFIYKNGARLLLGRESGYLILDPDLNANGPALNASTVVDAAASDYFTIQVQQSAASGNQTTWSRFSIMRLGV